MAFPRQLSIIRGTPYFLIESGPASYYGGVTGLVFNGPDLYRVSSYFFDPTEDQFSVEFELVPEPSTYALMFAGLAFLAFCVRR